MNLYEKDTKREIYHALQPDIIDDKRPELSDDEPLVSEFLSFKENGGTLSEFLILVGEVVQEYSYSANFLRYITNLLTKEDKLISLGAEIETKTIEKATEFRKELENILQSYKLAMESGDITLASVIFHISVGLGEVLSWETRDAALRDLLLGKKDKQ